MKHGRHEKILELIAQHEIGTQEELLRRLRESGFDVTQATVSRDIKELRLVKTLSGSGEYVYSNGKTDSAGDLSSKFDSLFRESVLQLDTVFNQVVVKCYSGLANAVCASMDGMHFEGVVGTIAGDDTILIIMRSEQHAAALYEKLRRKI